MDSELQTIDVLPATEQKFSVIWMHGLGADGHDFEAIVPELRLPEGHGIRFIFPNAPIQAVTINGGMKMRSWYDILEMSMEHKVDKTGINQSSNSIDQLIEKEMKKGIASENILLAGFSQGGVIALHSGLRFPYKLAGILALSTYLPTIEQIKIEATKENQSIPIFMAHGTMDPVVAIQNAKQAFNQLNEMQYPIHLHEYLMEHSVCHDEILAISQFIKDVLIKT